MRLLRVARTWTGDLSRQGHRGALLALGTCVAVLSAAPALAQGAGGQQVTPKARREACASDHARFCAMGTAGTQADNACLQQHHTNLTLRCRRTLAQSRATPAPIRRVAP